MPPAETTEGISTTNQKGNTNHNENESNTMVVQVKPIRTYELNNWAREVRKNHKLSSNAFNVLDVLLSNRKSKVGHRWYGKAWPKWEDISEESGLSRATVARAIKELREKNVISSVDLHGDKGQRSGTLYSFNLSLTDETLGAKPRSQSETQDRTNVSRVRLRATKPTSQNMRSNVSKSTGLSLTGETQYLVDNHVDNSIDRTTGKPNVSPMRLRKLKKNIMRKIDASSEQKTTNYEDDEYEEMANSELRDLCKSRKILFKPNMTKAELILRLTNHDNTTQK